MRILSILCLGLIALSGLAVPVDAQESSPILGLNCPDLLLEDYMLQGELVTQYDFEGKVAFVDIFQRGCPACDSHSMPHLQKMWEKYKDNPDVVILAINTAFEKNLYPIMADEEATKTYLKEKGWTMPVARDRDEKTVPLFRKEMASRPGTLTYGTPIAFVVDADGLIVAHEWNVDEDHSLALVKAFEEALTRVFPEIRDVDAALNPTLLSIQRRDFGAAWQSAEAVAGAAESTEAQLADATYLKEWITDYIGAREYEIEDAFRVNPAKSEMRLRKLAARFQGVPVATDLIVKADEWAKSEALTTYKKAQNEVQAILAEIEKAGYYLTLEQAQPMLDGLAKIGEGRTDVAALARDQAIALRNSFKGNGFMGIGVDQTYEGAGIRVANVMEGGPAEKGGLKKNDVITGINGTEVPGVTEFFTAMGATKPLQEVTFTVKRDGVEAPLEVKVVLGRRM